ncbi:ankyrin [Trypanosoma theileri]|uniref:Ankyrin n=1 Tax=Trypanosoma theileri TaxID=67003 RepID=A0A1X0NV32_9TRYP|nr:ankyrin [Trypanosoma theileri]ORC88542.1 ankyrin [Trypanosoma theileri]
MGTDADFFRAVERRDADLLRRLIAEGHNVNVRGSRNRTPLLMCVWEDYAEGARLLLEAGADVNALDDLHDSPFLLAGAEGRTAIMRDILRLGKPDMALRNRFGGSALIPACERGHVEIVEMLIDAGVDVDHVNNFGWTGLLEVIELGGDDLDHVKITKALIDAGADVNLADNKGNTPLHLARKHKLRRVAKLIEDAGGHE